MFSSFPATRRVSSSCPSSKPWAQSPSRSQRMATTRMEPRHPCPASHHPRGERAWGFLWITPASGNRAFKLPLTQVEQRSQLRAGLKVDSAQAQHWTDLIRTNKLFLKHEDREKDHYMSLLRTFLTFFSVWTVQVNAAQTEEHWGFSLGTVFSQRFVSQETAGSAYPPARSTAPQELCRHCSEGTQLPLLLLVCKTILPVGPRTTVIKEQKCHQTHHRGKIHLFLHTKSRKHSSGNWWTHVTVLSLF